MLGVSLLEQLLLITFSALVVSVDRVLQQIQRFKPDWALLSGFGRALVQGGHVHRQGAIEGRNRAEQAFLQVCDHQVLGRPLPLAGTEQPLIAQLPVARK